MKKVFICCLLFFFYQLGLCFAEPVSVDKAKLVATNFAVEQFGRKMVFDAQQPVSTEPVEKKNAYYVFNYSQGGWVIVSADDVAQPVIGYSTKGKYPTGNKPPQFEDWMKAVSAEIMQAVENKAKALPETESKWDRLAVSATDFAPLVYADTDVSAVPPLLTTTWNQGRYYNASCPVDSGGPDGRVWAGCVATAMAQVMKYHNHPSTGVGSHSYYHPDYGPLSANFGATTYNWSAMDNNLTSYNSAVATLLYHVGVSVDMNYGPNGSGAYVRDYGYDTSSATRALKEYFKYDQGLNFKEKGDYSDDTWKQLLKTEINSSRPVIYRGYNSDYTSGHAFVCDGYDSNDYFHFNWGWGGYADGYFLTSNLVPGGYNFTTYQGGIFGVKPADPFPWPLFVPAIMKK